MGLEQIVEATRSGTHRAEFLELLYEHLKHNENEWEQLENEGSVDVLWNKFEDIVCAEARKCFEEKTSPQKEKEGNI